MDMKEDIHWIEWRMKPTQKGLDFSIERKKLKLHWLLSQQSDLENKINRQIAVVMASPPWSHVGSYCVDHIVPLKGITPDGYSVSGLNVPWNLQIITLEDNSRKRNRMSKRDYEIACSLREEIKR